MSFIGSKGALEETTKNRKKREERIEAAVELELVFRRGEMKSGTKIAVITGSAGGLGKEFAEKLLASG